MSRGAVYFLLDLGMTKRQRVSSEVETEVLVRSARRCCLCYGLQGDFSEKRGQITHIDRDPTNSCLENLVYLCLEHHDVYDSKTSQSKGVTSQELVYYRNVLHADVSRNLPRLAEEPMKFFAAIRGDVPYSAPLLNGYEIDQAVRRGILSIDPYSTGQLGLAAYTLVLGREALVRGQSMCLDDKTSLILKPGDSADISTLEFISLPLNLQGRILPIHSAARRGLLVTSGLAVDPGYRGRLFLAVRNDSRDEAALCFHSAIARLELVLFNMPPEGWNPQYVFDVASGLRRHEER
jgi:deoxycytidine triphosphate deaminase